MSNMGKPNVQRLRWSWKTPRFEAQTSYEINILSWMSQHHQTNKATNWQIVNILFPTFPKFRWGLLHWYFYGPDMATKSSKVISWQMTTCLQHIKDWKEHSYDNNIIRAQLNATRKSAIIIASFHLSVCHTLIILMFGNLKHHLDLRWT